MGNHLIELSKSGGDSTNEIAFWKEQMLLTNSDRYRFSFADMEKKKH
jgi:hypothetical protein